MSELAVPFVLQVRYRNLFTAGLLSASVVPLVLSLLNFEITDASVYAIASLWSILIVLNSAHVWITLAYYCDRRWLAKFRKQPVTFFLAPAALVIGCTALMIPHEIFMGLALVYTALVINLWHHAKQNWGVLSLIGRSRSADVSYMRLPLIYAWPFFIVAVALYMPEISKVAGVMVLRSVAYLLASAYIAWCAITIWSHRSRIAGDRLTFVFAIALTLYFLPLVAMFGKPYALLVTFGAHAMQYYFLVLASLSLRTRTSYRSIAAALTLAVVTVALATYAAYQASGVYGPPSLWESMWVRLVVGFVTGINLVHFWVDAFIWRFSDRETRLLHGEAFAF
jgi:hypothetical protein